VLLCGVVFPDRANETGGALAEARGLVTASGAEVVGEVPVQKRDRAHPGTLFGKGKVEEIHEEIKRLQPDALIVDNDLTPAHVRNLENELGVRIVDRSELILDIFARRAKTRQAHLQVELAQVEYLLPRLRRMWTHLERLGGGVGTRGPGETQLETDRRLLQKKVDDLRRQLKAIEKRKHLQVLTRAEEFTVGLIGYTNAGKSTLLNKLTGAGVFAEDMLFATLDTRTRKWKIKDGRTVLMSDTIGFLQRLPHHLVASFHATLEEALNVDLLIHVVDTSHPDAALQMDAVEDVLNKLSEHRPADVIVFNKIDQVEDPLRMHLLLGDRTQEVVHLSAVTGEGLDRLDLVVQEHLNARSVVVNIRVPMEHGRVLAAIRKSGVLLDESVEGAEFVCIRAKFLERTFGNLKRRAPSGVTFSVEIPASDPFTSSLSGDEELPA
jgi:GTP-binding protein HflX